MKIAPYALGMLLAIAIMAPLGQAQIDSRASNSTPTINPNPRTNTSVRTSRIVGSAKASNHATGNSEMHSATNVSLAFPAELKNAADPVWGNAPARVEVIGPNVPKAATAAGLPAPSSSLTRIYRVGVGDVLDIKLRDVATRESTLFTVLAGGVVEYPLIEAPVKVEGMRVEEIAAHLASRIKVIDHPRLLVNVRDHASHNVVVTGLVYNPGSKALRQEAVPLYVVLAEAVTRQGATRATINRSGQTIAVDLADQTAISTLVVSGDLVMVSKAPAAAPQHYYAAGEINAPGEKTFRSGLTLTQALLASGGITQNASGRVRLTSQVNGAAPVTVEVNIKEILEGRNADPTLKPGDRLEVTRGQW